MDKCSTSLVPIHKKRQI